MDIVKDGSNHYLQLNEKDLIPVVYNAVTGSISIKGGQFIRNFINGGKTYYLHTIIWDVCGPL